MRDMFAHFTIYLCFQDVNANSLSIQKVFASLINNKTLKLLLIILIYY